MDNSARWGTAFHWAAVSAMMTGDRCHFALHSCFSDRGEILFCSYVSTKSKSANEKQKAVCPNENETKPTFVGAVQNFFPFHSFCLLAWSLSLQSLRHGRDVVLQVYSA